LELSDLPRRSGKVARSGCMDRCSAGFGAAVCVVGSAQQAWRERREPKPGSEALNPHGPVAELTVDIRRTR
jgi:hypothetical protein